MLEKLHAYDGQEVTGFSREAVAREKRDHPSEGMKGISPRSVMNRLSARAGLPDVECMSPLNALDSNLARTNRERQPHPRRVRQLHKLRPGSGHRIQRTRLPGRPEGVRRTLRANRRSPALRLPHRRERRHRSRRPTTQGIPRQRKRHESHGKAPPYLRKR